MEMTETKKILSRLPEVLLPWYAQNRRDLPWRQDREPYHVWLSEIMLQQTRVEAVRRYYVRFLEQLPTISTLSTADDALLHKLWEGLGYYSRVRNLKKAAQVMMDCYGGQFPETYEQVLKLPGVGEYTAGAVLSISFNQPLPAVDGNVLRVISRLTADETPVDTTAYKRQVWQALRAVYPEQAGDFTQALMELGATLCGPNWAPRCEQCPCRLLCKGLSSGAPMTFPVRTPKKARRKEEMTVFLLQCGNRYALERRPERGLLAGLWQFPNHAGKLDVPQALAAVKEMGLTPREIHRVAERKHIFTHVEWEMRGIYLEVVSPAGNFNWMDEMQIRQEVALPTAFRQFWEEKADV